MSLLLTNTQRKPPPHPWNKPDAPRSTLCRAPTDSPNQQDHPAYFPVPLPYTKGANAPRPDASETPDPRELHTPRKGSKHPPPDVPEPITRRCTQRSMRTPPLNTEESNPSTTQSRSPTGDHPTPNRTHTSRPRAPRSGSVEIPVVLGQQRGDVGLQRPQG